MNHYPCNTLQHIADHLPCLHLACSKTNLLYFIQFRVTNKESSFTNMRQHGNLSSRILMTSGSRGMPQFIWQWLKGLGSETSVIRTDSGREISFLIAVSMEMKFRDFSRFHPCAILGSKNWSPVLLSFGLFNHLSAVYSLQYCPPVLNTAWVDVGLRCCT